MFHTGMVSVTFRKKTRAEITDITKKAGLDFIEWGGDIHVPVGDFSAADEARRLTEENGLRTVSYGSYFKCEDCAFSSDLETAVRLGAPNIRIWAGNLGSADADPAYRKTITDSIAAVCREAGKYNMTVTTEFHVRTLTDHYESAVRMAEEVGEDNFRLYWQPNQYRDEDYNLSAVRAVLPYLQTVHVFNWSGNDRYPLGDAESIWRRYIDIIASSGKDHNLLLEFVPNETDEEFIRDAVVLKSWLR